MARRHEAIEGRYVYVEGPCTTVPCLPGMAYAVETRERRYFVTVDGRWLADNRSWGGYTPQPGDTVAVHGRVGERRDVFGKPFSTIEASAVARTRAT